MSTGSKVADVGSPDIAGVRSHTIFALFAQQTLISCDPKQ